MAKRGRPLLSHPNEPYPGNGAPVTGREPDAGLAASEPPEAGSRDSGPPDGGSPDKGPLDKGPGDRSPQRRCIVTRVSRPVDDLIRFVRTPDGTVVPDLRRRLPGRGVWIGAERRLVVEAQRRKLFGRAFKADARAPDDLADQVGALLRRSVLDRLGLERKAGRLRLGFTEVDRLLRSGDCVLLVTAIDAAEDGVRKIGQAAHAGGHAGDHSGRRTPYACRAFTTAELGLALGRGNVIHAALQRGGASDAVIASCRRLDRYMGPAETADRDVTARKMEPAGDSGRESRPGGSAGRTE